MGIVWGRGLRGGPATPASMAINESLAPPDVVILEQETADTAMVSADVLVIGRDLKLQ